MDNVISFVLLMALMVAAAYVGLRASKARKAQLRETIVANKGELSAVAELVRQGKRFQAESVLMRRGNTRSVARTSIVIIRELIKSGEWD